MEKLVFQLRGDFMNLAIIAAVGKNKELGKDNDLLWRFSLDMKVFKKLTMGHKMVMGRKTFESLPGLLPGRDHIVITRQGLALPKNVEIYHSPMEFLEAYKDYEDVIFNIGGASIYKELFDYSDKLYLTEINDSKEADVYFPDFDEKDFDKDIILDNFENGIEFKHVFYKRRK